MLTGGKTGQSPKAKEAHSRPEHTPEALQVPVLYVWVGQSLVPFFLQESRRRNAKCCEVITRVPLLAARKCAKCHAGRTTFIWAAVLVCFGFREEEVNEVDQRCMT